MSVETFHNSGLTSQSSHTAERQQVELLADAMYWDSMEVGIYSGRTPGAESAIGSILVDRCTGPDTADGSFYTKPDGTFFELHVAQAAWQKALARRHDGGRPQPMYRAPYYDLTTPNSRDQ